MLVVSGASTNSPRDHARPHHALNDVSHPPAIPSAAMHDMHDMPDASDPPPDAPAAAVDAPTPDALAAPASGPASGPSNDLNDLAVLPDLNVLPGLPADGARPDMDAGVSLAPAAPTTPTTTTATDGLPPLSAPIPLNLPMAAALPIDLPMDMDVDMNMNNMNGIANMGLGMGMPSDLLPMELPQNEERLTAFARLRFDDGSYYMHTYQIILGRNIALAHRDMRRLAKVDRLHAQGHPEAAHELLHGKKRKRSRRPAPSVISEKGGIVSARIESMPAEYQQSRQGDGSQSVSSSSNKNGEAGQEKLAERAPQDVIMQAFPERPDQLDHHVPENPHDCPLVPIHPEHITAKTGNQGPKGISRQHAKIFYNFSEGGFCIEVLGSNGLHHEGTFHHQGEIVSLDHGDSLVIGAVNMQFYLPDIALTEEQRHRQESGSRPMSFSFENGHGEMESEEQLSSESEGELSINPRHVYYHPVDSDIESEDDAVDDDMDEYQEPEPKPRIKIKIRAPRSVTPEPRKKSRKEKLKALKKKKKEKEKRKYREERDYSPDEPPLKKIRPPVKEPVSQPVKETKATKETKEIKEIKETKEPKEPKEIKEPKEPKEVKDKGKAPAKTQSPVKPAAKTPIKEEPAPEAAPKEIPVKEKPEPTKSAPTDSPPLLRKPLEAEIEAGEIEGLITEEMARQHNLPASLVGHVVEKRKGPGRPPKDGIMSKRQRSQLIKQAKEIERAKAAGIDPADIPAPTIKPKITKRKDSNAGDGDDDDIRESTEKGDGTLSGDKKQAKPIKPPRTPSPEMRIEDYTEEQLQRPSANYVVLIHEAISSSNTGQMNLQQIYNYIEKKYPWYKFKTTTSGWQSSVRHNLGQHDAFVKGDKEGKGFNWRINPEVSIEKERRKRQVSPPVNHAQRQPYYPPPPNGYPGYPQPGHPYYPGMPPHGMPQAAPRLPPSLAPPQPRLPPSMARDANATASATPQGPSHPSPYASPWAGGNPAGSPPTPMPPRPYPQANSQTPPVSSAGAGPSGQYGVLYPTNTPQSYNGPTAPSPYGGQYATAGASPYASAPARPYAPYPPQGQHMGTPGANSQPTTAPPPPPQPPTQAHTTPYAPESAVPHSSGRYPLNTHPDLIRQLEAFRQVYLQARTEAGEDKKVDNAIRAYVDSTVPEATLSPAERALLGSISRIEGLQKYRTNAPAVKQESAPVHVPTTTSTVAAGTAAAIAADAAANTPPSGPQSAVQQAPQQMGPSVAAPAPTSTPQPTSMPQQTSMHQQNSEPHKFTPNMTGAPSPVPGPGPSLPPSLRPSVEPLTPVPGSPAIQKSTPLKPVTAEAAADSQDGLRKAEGEAASAPPKTE
jgi:hypothetical protein